MSDDRKTDRVPAYEDPAVLARVAAILNAGRPHGPKGENDDRRP